VKDSNPLDGSFGGSPVTVTYVVFPWRPPLRGAVVVILYLLDARVNRSVHSFFSPHLFFFSEWVEPAGFEPATFGVR
jgi:hypothetical protein